MIENLEDLANDLISRARAGGFKLQGPVATDLGYGGAPTVTFWSGDRRVHFHFENIRGAIAVLAEAAEVAPERRVQVGRVETVDQAWKLIDRFLRWRRGFDELPDLQWMEDAPAHDPMIPHPPDSPQGGAQPVAGLVGSFKKSTAPSEAPSDFKPQVDSVGAVILHSSDPARLAEWYRDALGLSVRRAGDFFFGDIGAVNFGILPSDKPIPPPGRVMINYRVREFDAFVLELARKGIAVEGLNATEQGRFAYVRDGDGNPIEVWSGPSTT